MKSTLKRTYTSVEELMSSCATSELKSLVSSILRGDTYIKWDLVSCSVESDLCKAEFVSQIEGANLVHHLSCVSNERGQFGHMEITDLTPAVASMKL